MADHSTLAQRHLKTIPVAIISHTSVEIRNRKAACTGIVQNGKCSTTSTQLVQTK